MAAIITVVIQPQIAMKIHSLDNVSFLSLQNAMIRTSARGKQSQVTRPEATDSRGIPSSATFRRADNLVQRAVNPLLFREYKRGR